MAGLLGFTLADLTQAVDARKRQYANLVGGLLSDPGATLAQLAAQDAEQRAQDKSWVGASQSAMPEVRDAAMQRGMQAALNTGGLLAITRPAGAPWYAKPEQSDKPSSAEWAGQRTPAALADKMASEFSAIIHQDIASRDFSARGLKAAVLEAAQQREISPGYALRALASQVRRDPVITGARKEQLFRELLGP